MGEIHQPSTREPTLAYCVCKGPNPEILIKLPTDIPSPAEDSLVAAGVLRRVLRATQPIREGDMAWGSRLCSNLHKREPRPGG